MTTSSYVKTRVTGSSTKCPTYAEGNDALNVLRLQTSGMGLFYIRVNVKALVTGSIRAHTIHDLNPASKYILIEWFVPDSIQYILIELIDMLTACKCILNDLTQTTFNYIL
jgi:hypothetical protein